MVLILALQFLIVLTQVYQVFATEPANVLHLIYGHGIIIAA